MSSLLRMNLCPQKDRYETRELRFEKNLQTYQDELELMVGKSCLATLGSV